MTQHHSLKRNLFILHFTVFIWGFTGILGALISISAVHLVWYRVLIAFTTLFIYFKIVKTPIRMSWQDFAKLFFTGAIVGLHWILFFQSIKLSTVSVTLVCLSSMTLFTAFLEPLIKRQKIALIEILVGLIIVFGIYLIFKFETKYTLGIISGLVSALCASLFSIINSRQIKRHAAPIISFYELLGAWVWISLYMAFTNGFNQGLNLQFTDTLYLLLLGVICTAVAYVAGVSVMKEISAFRVALITNLEPVYGILLAFLFFGEQKQLTSGFYAGAVIVLSAIFMYPVIRNKVEKRKIQKRIPLG
ncbi:EamA family transporter [Pedobacter sp. BS3]|uniref:DMT family transporter n=1 Tax=Pedobacter sp. BS3 TaxID=2567937 RepID=UPI0011EE3B23|nr:EamA family transporter [Pedobacter sp. BS3]TZF82677.1 EamA family transporter [Pedobacter sp. BS3]